MKVRYLTGRAGIKIYIKAGDVEEVSAGKAERLIKGNFAEKADEEAEITIIQTAILKPVKRRKKRKKAKNK